MTLGGRDTVTAGTGEGTFPAGHPALPVKDIGRLLLRCSDRSGLVAAVSSFLAHAGANIISLDQHSTQQTGGIFMQRTIFHLPGLAAARTDLERRFAVEVAEPFAIDFRLTEAAKPKRVAIMASTEDHCLLDLLWRNRRGDLDMSVAMVIANHADLADQVRPFGVPFIHIPATRDTREQAESRQLELLRGNVDLVVLARYMQILTPRFLTEVGCPLINIHHSFLPAFIGAAPYRRAKERGVKLVGATAHYVTEDLDEGPIIEQDVVRVDHRHGVEDLVRLGADVERAVLSRAVQWHCEDRVIRYGNQTVVF
jgi:formyltetrahydrofolate deformylase